MSHCVNTNVFKYCLKVLFLDYWKSNPILPFNIHTFEYICLPKYFLISFCYGVPSCCDTISSIMLSRMFSIYYYSTSFWIKFSYGFSCQAHLLEVGVRSILKTLKTRQSFDNPKLYYQVCSISFVSLTLRWRCSIRKLFCWVLTLLQTYF